MMKQLFVILSVFFSTHFLFAQQAGVWDTHFSYSNAISQIVQGGDLTYVLTDGKLFTYNQSDSQTAIVVNKNGANNNIVQIAYNSQNKCLIIYRDDANIDLLYSGNQLVNIPDLKNANQNIDKTLNSIFVQGDSAYLCTNFGILVLDLAKSQIAETAIFKLPFYAMCIYENRFYAATQNGVLSMDQTQNLLNFANWTPFPVSSRYKFTDYTFADTEIQNLGVFKDQLHFFVPNKAIYVLENDGTLARTLQGQSPQVMLPLSNDCLIAYNNDFFWNFADVGQSQMTRGNGIQYVINNPGNANQYWLAVNGYNLSLIKTIDGTESYDIISTQIKPDGPLTNFPFFMRYDRGKLMLVGGGFNYDNLGIPGELSELVQGKWFNYNLAQINSTAGISSRDFTSVVADPTDINHLFVTSWGDGLYEFKDQACINRYTPSNTNGVLEDIFGGSGFVRMNGMEYDASGNLWMTNAMVDSPIKTMQKNGQWVKLYYSQIANDAVTNDQHLMIDRYNDKWLTTTKTGSYPPYIFISNDKGSLSDTSDDATLYVNSFTDQDGNNLAIEAINGLTEDKDGNVWVASDIGPFVVYNSPNIFNQRMTFYSIKVPRNDGTSDADILLNNVVINKIAVDGANQKWIATKSAGVYLVSSDGNRTIYNFNTSNSPLPSNNVISLAIDGSTGVVYIGTDKGIVSFAGRVTDGSTSFSNVRVYPNPVRPNYNGVITITGLEANSTVKITDVNSNIIVQGSSQGGSFTWDGNNVRGQKVATGVYLVIAVNEDGSSGVATKIMIVN